MITISEATPLEMTTFEVERRRQMRQRTGSESLGDNRRRGSSNGEIPERKNVQRSASCSELLTQRRERQRRELNADVSRYHVRLSCRDEALCVRSQENLLRLVKTVQQEVSASDTSVLLAKKALKYRRLLTRAQQVDLSDPTFDVARFVREKRDGRPQYVELCRPTSTL